MPITGRIGGFLWFPRTSRVPLTRDPGPPQVGAIYIYRKKERKKEIPYKEGKLKDIGSH